MRSIIRQNPNLMHAAVIPKESESAPQLAISHCDTDSRTSSNPCSTSCLGAPAVLTYCSRHMAVDLCHELEEQRHHRRLSKDAVWIARRNVPFWFGTEEPGMSCRCWLPQHVTHPLLWHLFQITFVTSSRATHSSSTWTQIALQILVVLSASLALSSAVHCAGMRSFVPWMKSRYLNGVCFR